MEKVLTDGQDGIGGGDGTSDGQKWEKADGTSRGGRNWGKFGGKLGHADGRKNLGKILGNLGFFLKYKHVILIF